MPSPAINSLPCPGCRALQSEVLRDRKEMGQEIRRLEDRLRRLRQAIASETFKRRGMLQHDGMTDEELIERLTGGDGS